MTTLLYITLVNESEFFIIIFINYILIKIYIYLFIHDFKLCDTIESPVDNRIFTSLANSLLHMTDLENVILKNTH